MSDETTSGTTVISSDAQKQLADRLGDVPDDPREHRRIGPKHRARRAAERGADDQPEEDADVQRYPPRAVRAIVGLLVEIGDDFPLKLFHVGRRFYSAGGRNNMSAKHGRHQGSPQPESAAIAARCPAAAAARAICLIR